MPEVPPDCEFLKRVEAMGDAHAHATKEVETLRKVLTGAVVMILLTKSRKVVGKASSPERRKLRGPSVVFSITFEKVKMLRLTAVPLSRL